MLNHSFYQRLYTNTTQRKSHLCIGLDPDLSQIPCHFSQDLKGLHDFLVEVIETTSALCIAYKPNLAFFEALGIDGLRLLESIRKRIPTETPVIIDGKRGDIGNTSAMQAKYIFDYFGADATTLNPLMGLDSLAPFFRYKDKYNFVLTLTSNPGAHDFEKQTLDNKQPLYLYILDQCDSWHNAYGNVGCVVGATQQEFTEIRKHNTNLIFLIPGIGAQGGEYHDAVRVGKNQDGLALVNISRSILYGSTERDFATQMRQKIQSYLDQER